MSLNRNMSRSYRRTIGGRQSYREQLFEALPNVQGVRRVFQKRRSYVHIRMHARAAARIGVGLLRFGQP
jgi:hypothetical protein